MKDYRLTEQEYFEYYQNSCDPTFEFYPFPEREEEGANEKITKEVIIDDLDIFLKENEIKNNS